ncbi:extradiol dioxygenase [Mycobacterium kubicae]|nr:VOC family protein [Mycobacterium kubicae]ORV98933.1 extradiol dioxygenase [Mycobacterium kubicae]QNI14512.1 VOC family protein [Mycobacterium kubicae]QPI40438.1 VOC family protein [Mycobacterium kubicae]
MEVGVVTTNLEPMVEFYENYLGLALQTELRFPTGVQRRYAIGKNVLKLVTYDQPPPSGVVPGGGYTQEGFRYISLFVKDIANVAKRLKESPYQVVEELTEFTAIPGWWWLFVTDPDGNWIELAGPREDTA